MQDENLLNKIRHSADSIEMPENLKPESIEKKLAEASPKKSRIPTNRLGTIAAACLVLLAVCSIPLVMRNSRTPAAEDCSEFAAECSTADITDENAAYGQEAAAIRSSDSYDTLYGKLKSISYSYDCTTEVEAAADEMEADYSANTMTQGAESAVSSSSDGTLSESRKYSETNVSVTGIDEGDIIKTDGTYIYILKQNQELFIVDADSMEQVGKLTPENYSESIEEMYLDGTTLQLIGTSYDTDLQSDSDVLYTVTTQGSTTLYTYDVSDPGNIKPVGQVTQSGYYKSSRKNGGYVYLFTQYSPDVPDDSTQQERYVPSVNDELLSADSIYIPEICNQASSLVISSIDSDHPDRIVDSKAVVSGAEEFYVSGQTIYISNTDWSQESGEQTQIVSFSYRDGQITAQAAGMVPGYLNDNFSMDEYENHLRVVSTSWDDNNYTDINALYVLDENLKITGKIENLAPDETIRSARFMGDTGYFVTYRQTDPLFSVDLSDPGNPQILGELKITGFSEYLHVYDDNLLLGIGWETDPDTAETIGLKMSMFDISDPGNVIEKDKYVIKNVYTSPAAYNYKAVMIDPEKNIFGFAYEAGSTNDSDSQNYSIFSYDKEQGFINEMTSNLNNENSDYLDLYTIRGLYIDSSFYLYTGESLIRFDMANEYQANGKLNL